MGTLLLLVSSILVCALANSCQMPQADASQAETLHPPENLSIGMFGNGLFSSLHWSNPNRDVVSLEFEWRFSDVPYWVHLGSAPPGATMFQGPFAGGSIAEWNFTSYCYRGRAVLGDSTSEWSDEICADMSAGEPYNPPIWPPVPTEVAGEAVPGGVRLTWSILNAGQFGSPHSLVLRRGSTKGTYRVIGKLPFGTFEFIDKQGGHINCGYCYRIGTSFEDRGKSVSRDVCIP